MEAGRDLEEGCRVFYKEIRAANCHPDSKQQCKSSHPWRQVAHVRPVAKREFRCGNFHMVAASFFLFCFLTVELQDCFLIIRVRRARWHLVPCTSSPPDTRLSSIDLSVGPLSIRQKNTSLHWNPLKAQIILKTYIYAHISAYPQCCFSHLCCFSLRFGAVSCGEAGVINKYKHTYSTNTCTTHQRALLIWQQRKYGSFLPISDAWIM